MRGPVVLAIGGLVLLPTLFILMAVMPEKGIAVGLCLATVFAGIVLAGYAGTRWQCTKCGHVFDIGAWTDLTSPHDSDSKRLCCPKCGHVGWAKAVKRMRKAESSPRDTEPSRRE